MSLLENTVLEVEQNTLNDSVNAIRSHRKDEMTIKTKQVIRHECPMPNKIKLEKQQNAPSLDKLLNLVIKEKGEVMKVNISRNAANELEIEGLSKQTLHSFLLKVEELGKTITYTRTLKVEITDK